ncbi:acyl-CoA dehydrogenase N-terminal domain-containing protein, partial [Oleiphilus sp. HI0125]
MIINQDTLNFLLYDVFQAEALTELDAYKDHDRSTFDGVIDTSLKIAQDYFLPHNAKADANEPSFDGESVSTIPEVKEAWKHFTEAGLINARHRFDEGGMQLPALVHSACMGLFTGANPSTAGYPFLTSA